MVKTTDTTMDDLLAKSELAEIKAMDLIDGTVISIQKHEVWLDIGHLGVGLISRRELIGQEDLEVGQKVTVSVVSPETKQGYALLSLRKVMKDKSWDEIQKIYENNQIVTVTSYDANRGGLLVELQGVRGFLPISQLSINHYPRVNSFDKEEILTKLNQLINQPLKVCILDLNRAENKLIFSEKEALKEVLSDKLKNLKVGDIVEGVVTGVTDFGAFINIEGIEGLIHISEISWGRVEDPRRYIKVAEKLKVKIITIDDERIALSLKQMTEDPWEKEIVKFKEGDEVEGVITRITPYGAFVRLSPVIEALLYLMYNADDDNPRGKEEKKNLERIKRSIKVGESKQFIISGLDKEARKISLKLK